MSKQLTSSILLFLLLSLPVSGNALFTTSLEGGSSWYMGFPHYTDSIPFRSSVTGDGEYGFGVYAGGWEVSALVPFHYVSASPTFDGLSRRSFFSVGGGLRIGYLFSKTFGWFLSGSLRYNEYAIDQAFLSFGIKTGPYWQFLSSPSWRMSLVLPIGVDLRNDITGLMIGLSVRLSYDKEWDGSEGQYAY